MSMSFDLSHSYSSPCNSLYPGYFFVFAEKQECVSHWTYYHTVLLTLQQIKTGIFWIFAEQQESVIICHVTDRHNSVLHAYNREQFIPRTVGHPELLQNNEKCH